MNVSIEDYKQDMQDILTLLVLITTTVEMGGTMFLFDKIINKIEKRLSDLKEENVIVPPEIFFPADLDHDEYDLP